MAIRISGMASGMDTEAMVQDLVKAYKTKGSNYTKQQKRAELKQDAWKSLNKKIKSFTTKYTANMQYSTYYASKKTTVSDSSKASVVSSDGAVTGSQSLEVNKLATTAYLTGAKINNATGSTKLSELMGGSDFETTIKLNGEEEGFTIDQDTTIDEFVGFMSAKGFNASFDENNGRIFISAKNSGAASDFSFDTSDPTAKNALVALGLETDTTKTNPELATYDKDYEGPVKIPGEDAQIKLNGATFTNSSNTFNINGLTITAKEKTDSAVSISTDTDYDAIYDKIKSFIKDYSSLINEMTELYNAPANKGYDPLTDEEKEALSESEVKKWEDKVNESLLRRDGNLSSLSSILRNSMLQTYDYEGTTYSLSSFGINTLSYFTAPENERNAYHIDGDPDDSETSGNTDKLKAAIAANPDAVVNFFTKLSKNMYDQLQEFSKSSSSRSYGSFYDDKQMKEDITKYENKVTKWDDYVKSIEDRYYKQFAKMESAMSTLNSQQNYISSMFGM
ncbi:MAG: flagellar filament capping protein FliD [Lachnospiraceae bacterium]|nr:flagellar filament capping protein FliD [Lachnospiraceae bacterium]